MSPATVATLTGQAIGALSGSPARRGGVFAGLAQTGFVGLGYTREEAEQAVLNAKDSYDRAPVVGVAIGGAAGLAAMLFFASRRGGT